MKRAFAMGIVVVALAAGALLNAQSARSADVQMKAAQQKAEVEGDLKGAIEEYKKVVAAAGGNRALAAQALVAMADCYQKLGDPEARSVYQRIVRDYSDQKDAAALARRRLGGVATAQPLKGITLRRAWDGQAAGAPTARVLASVSADGHHVPYIGPDGVVNLHDLASGTDRPLTVADQCGGPSAISRDGTQVAYERYCGKFGSELRLVNVRDNGVPASRLLYENADVAQITPMDVSPDGSLIAVTLVRKDRSKQIGLVTGGSGSLRVLKSVDWRGPTRIFFSPNGRDLAYDLPANDTSNQRDVFVLAVDGSREVAVVTHPANDAVMGWSPDGKHLLFASDRRGGAMGLWVQAIEDQSPRGTPALVMESINSAFSLGVTSSGALYLGKIAGDRDISVVPIDLATGKQTGPPAKPVQNFIGTNLEPAYSPDGKALAYVSWRNNNPIFGDPRVLAIRSLDTGETRELRPNLVYFDQVSWAPDGRAFVTGGTDPKGRNGIFRIDARTGDVTPIAQLPLGFERSFPQWSPSGNHIYYRVPLNEDAINEDVAFIERTMASGAEREVARGALGAISLSPDGRWIAAQKTDPATKSEALVLIPIGGGKTRELLRARQPERIVNQLSGIPWTPDSRNVLLRRRRTAGSVELWLVSIADAPPRKLDVDVTQWATGNRGFISLSPDGRQIAFLTGQTNAEVWVLENVLPALTKR
jgi:Tol biopolymer transport system component